MLPTSGEVFTGRISSNAIFKSAICSIFHQKIVIWRNLICFYIKKIIKYLEMLHGYFQNNLLCHVLREETSLIN